MRWRVGEASSSLLAYAVSACLACGLFFAEKTGVLRFAQALRCFFTDAFVRHSTITNLFDVRIRIVAFIVGKVAHRMPLRIRHWMVARRRRRIYRKAARWRDLR